MIHEIDWIIYYEFSIYDLNHNGSLVSTADISIVSRADSSIVSRENTSIVSQADTSIVSRGDNY